MSANGYRLPLEAEWEFAARGGNESNGYTYAGSNSIHAVAWFWYNSTPIRQNPHSNVIFSPTMREDYVNNYVSR